MCANELLTIVTEIIEIVEKTELFLGEKVGPGLISQGYFQRNGVLVCLVNISNYGDLLFSWDNDTKFFSLTVEEANERLSLEDPTEDPNEEKFFTPSWS